jgi:hypothetical protein
VLGHDAILKQALFQSLVTLCFTIHVLMLLPVDIIRFSTFPQPYESGMPEVVVRGPLEEFELSNKGRF